MEEKLKELRFAIANKVPKKETGLELITLKDSKCKKEKITKSYAYVFVRKVKKINKNMYIVSGNNKEYIVFTDISLFVVKGDAVVKDFGSAIEYNNEWGAKARLENVKAARYDSIVVGRNKKRKMAYVFVDKDTILR